MAEQWFTEEQVQKVAHDLREMDITMADAMDMLDAQLPSWDELGDEARNYWATRATAELSKVVPLDLTKPIRLRDGMPVYDIKLSEDGLGILARVIAWGQEGTQAFWQRDGRSGGGEDYPTDLVYADDA
jgi:hypothetical protein